MRLLTSAVGGLAALCLLAASAFPIFAPSPAAAQGCTPTVAPNLVAATMANAQLEVLTNLCALQAGKSYRLATSQTIASGACTAPVSITAGGSYLVAVTSTGWSGTVTLQALGPDGATYAAVSGASWTNNNTLGVVIGTGATIKLCASGGSPAGVNAVAS